MKIVHVMNWYIPEMGYQENYLPAEQKKLGYNVEIITSDRIPPYKGYQRHIGKIISERIVGTGVFEENGVKIHRLPVLFEIKNGGQLLLKGLKKKLKQLKPDIVQAHGAFSLLTLQVIFYSEKLGYKVFVDDHSHKNNFCLDSLYKRAYVKMVKGFYHLYGKRVCCWMPVTYASKHILQSFLAIPDEKIKLLHLGVNTNRFKKSQELREIGRKEIGISDDDFLIISSGKFNKSKDIHILIKAFDKVSKKYPKTKLLLIGGGPDCYMRKLKNLIKSLDLDNKVFFRDFVPNIDLPKYYNAADAGVWPGDHSITVIEAIATGLPVIVPENDLAYKILFENKAALGFERGNPDAITNKIAELIENHDLYSEIANNALSLVEKTLSWNKIAEESISIYSTYG